MWRYASRYGARAYWGVSEAVLRLLGRRRPYGILRLTLARYLSEEPTGYRLPGLPQRARDDYFSLIRLLRWAREDPDLRAVFVRCIEVRLGWARIQEVRRSLAELRRAGKLVWMHFVQAGIHEYALASVADRVILAPAGKLDVAGLSSEVTFLAGTLSKLGVEAELVQMGKYKSAAEMFTRCDMSEPHREMVESLIDDLYGQVVEAVAEGRRIEPADIRALLDRGPFLARQAAEARLVDAVLYEDEAEDQLRAQCDNAAIIDKDDYFSRRAKAARREVLRRGRASIGLLHLSGTVKMGESIPGPEGANACGAASVSHDLKELRDRDDIRAVVVRISSPGGSGLASDLIWHEVVRTRRRKPVVISFGDVAASGGYYVGVAGSPVLAESGTITGSIGVLAGKAVLRGLYDHLGVTKQVVTRGRHAALYSSYVPLGDEERRLLQSEAECFYSDFLNKVADGRHMSQEAVAAAAQGRVWTGRQAQALGLDDQLGGLERALDEAKVLGGLTPEDVVRVELYPKPKRLWKLSLNLNPPQSRLGALLPRWRFLTGERVWAVLPVDFRFY